MKTETKKRIATFVGVSLMSFLLIQLVWRISSGKKENSLSGEKVNLALRRTAHVLLKNLGDSTSQISPVKEISANVWEVSLGKTLDYKKLPAILQSSFKMHDIENQYDVAVVKCQDGVIQLGYNGKDLLDAEGVPCVGREVSPDCFNLRVTFSMEEEKIGGWQISGWILTSFLAISLVVFGQKGKKIAANFGETNPAETDWLVFGNSKMDVSNQLLICGAKSHSLTFREAKLLNLFVIRPNQVLERSFILDNVWADEGVLVGRSVDVFVSRLRKMLRDDPTVVLSAVHGVGYRLEVGS